MHYRSQQTNKIWRHRGQFPTIPKYIGWECPQVVCVPAGAICHAPSCVRCPYRSPWRQVTTLFLASSCGQDYKILNRGEPKTHFFRGITKGLRQSVLVTDYADLPVPPKRTNTRLVQHCGRLHFMGLRSDLQQRFDLGRSPGYLSCVSVVQSLYKTWTWTKRVVLSRRAFPI